MPVNEFDVKHIMTKLASADSALQMIRDIWPEAADMLTRVHDAHADIRAILSWRADDAPPTVNDAATKLLKQIDYMGICGDEDWDEVVALRAALALVDGGDT